MALKDARTTPPRLRLPALILVGLVGAYFAVCMVLEFVEGPGKAKTLVGARSFGQWNMFTLRATWNKQVRAKVLVDGDWSEVNLAELYRARWESGARYQRPAFLRKGGLTPLLTHSICQRVTPAPDRVRLYSLRWKRKLGVSQAPEGIPVDADFRTLLKALHADGRDPKAKVILEWPCSRKIRKPGGTVL